MVTQASLTQDHKHLIHPKRNSVFNSLKLNAAPEMASTITLNSTGISKILEASSGKRTFNRNTLLGKVKNLYNFIFATLRRQIWSLSQLPAFWSANVLDFLFAAVQSVKSIVPKLQQLYSLHILYISETKKKQLKKSNFPKTVPLLFVYDFKILRQTSLVMFVFLHQTFMVTILPGLFFCFRASSVGSYLQQKSGSYFPQGHDAHRTEGPPKVKVFSKLWRHRGRRQQEMKSQNLGRLDNICVYVGAACVRLCIWQCRGMCGYNQKKKKKVAV